MLAESQEILVHFVRVIKRGNRLSRCKNRALNARARFRFRFVIAKDRKKKKEINWPISPPRFNDPHERGESNVDEYIGQGSEVVPCPAYKSPPSS